MTHFGFAAFIFGALMGFALVASFDAHAAEPGTEAYYDEQVAFIKRGKEFFEGLWEISNIPEEHRQGVRNALDNTINAAYNAGFSDGVTTTVEELMEPTVDEPELDPGLGCITDSECEGLDPDTRYFSS